MSFAVLEQTLFYLLVFFLPTQLGKHFWPDFSIVSGIRVDYLSPILYLTDVFVGLLLALWFFRKVQSAKFKVQSHNVKLKSFNLKVLIIFLAFLILNILFSQNILNGLYHLFKLLEFGFIGFYVATRIKSLEKIKKTFLFLAIAGIFESLLAIAQFINQGSLGGLFYFFGERMFNSSTPGIANASINGELLLRPYGTFPHPNVLAGFLICVMAFSLWTFGVSKKHWEKIFFSSALFIGTGALILTMSRVAIVLWVFVLLLSAITSLRGGTTKQSYIRLPRSFQSLAMTKKKNVLIIFVSGLLIFIFFLSPFSARLFGTRIHEEAVIQRQELVASSFKLFAKQPILGVGLGNFIPSLVNVQKPLSPGLYLQPVHNIFLLVLAETGIIGFGFFVWLIVKTYKYLLNNLKTHPIFLVLLTSVLILGFFDHYFLTLQQGQLLFAIILGLCWTKFDPRT